MQKDKLILFWVGLYDQIDGTMSGKHNRNTRVILEENKEMHTDKSSTHSLYISELDYQTGNINRVKYAPMWKKLSKETGNVYYTGDDSLRINIVIHKNRNKTEDKHPDWVVFKSEKITNYER